MFKDHAVVYVQAGRGGDGCVAFRRELFAPKGGPFGGDGGRGGSIHFVADHHESTLLSLVRNPHIRGESGDPGQGKTMEGRSGEDVVVKVPVGTLIFDKEKNILLRDLKAHGDTVCVARGGNGGYGNKHFATATNQAPRKAIPGQEGEKRTLRLELRLIADVGLVGLPNAGKSTLISRVSAARPKIADYPFTTLHPHPGIVELSGERRFVMVDIPGLIEGASEGHGLGHRFLKHVERTRALVHLVELAPADGSDPAENYAIIVRELERYSAALAMKPRLTVYTKADLVPDPDDRVRELNQRLGIEAYAISSAVGTGIDRTLEEAWRMIAGVPVPPLPPELASSEDGPEVDPL